MPQIKNTKKPAKKARKTKAARKSSGRLREEKKSKLATAPRKPKKTEAQKKSKVKISQSKKVTLRPTPLRREIVRPLKDDKPGVSYLTIVRNTREKEYFANVRVLRFKGDRIKLPDGSYRRAIATATRTTDQKPDSPREWKQVINAKDPAYKGALYKCPHVVVHCQCQNFQFEWEYALWKQGSAQIISGNGEAPTKWNVRGVPGGCKHLFAAYHKLKELGL